MPTIQLWNIIDHIANSLDYQFIFFSLHLLFVMDVSERIYDGEIIL